MTRPVLLDRDPWLSTFLDHASEDECARRCNEAKHALRAKQLEIVNRNMAAVARGKTWVLSWGIWFRLAREGSDGEPLHVDNVVAGELLPQRVIAAVTYLSDAYDGGAIAFPSVKDASGEPYAVKPQRGSTLIFPCNLPHSVEPVTRGSRYAFNGCYQPIEA